MDINEVTLLGSIKEISNILTMKNGQQCCLLSIHTDISFEKKDGTMGHIQNNHRVIAYGKYATAIKEKSSVKQKIFIQGRLKVTNWEYKNKFFEKEFIVVEKFKLHPFIKDDTKELEDDDPREDMIEDECDCGDHEEHKRHDNPENYDAGGKELEEAPDWYGGTRQDYDNYKDS